MIEEQVAGEPQTGRLWVSQSLSKIQDELAEQAEIKLSGETIRRLLSDQKIRPRSNVKRLCPNPHPDRDRQFQLIHAQRIAFEKAGWPCISVDTKKKELIGLFQNAGATWRREATAYYAQTDTPIAPILISDDAPQFQHITQEQALCWIHEGRLYKKLVPFVDYHRQLLEEFHPQFWGFYRQFRAYRARPSPEKVGRLRQKFDTIFSTCTGYDALDKRIAKTQAKKSRLLVVLDHPEVPLHNNPAELGARQRVRKRDISFGPRTAEGVEAWDTFMTITETAKKLGVNLYEHIYDRVSQAQRLPGLDQLIHQRATAPHDNSTLS